MRVYEPVPPFVASHDLPFASIETCLNFSTAFMGEGLNMVNL